MNPASIQQRELLRELFAAAVNAVRGDRLLIERSSVSSAHWSYSDDAGRLDIPLPVGEGRLIVVGAGKAAASLALGLEHVLGDRIDDGVVIVKAGHTQPLQRIRCREGGHPVPDTRSVAATKELLALVEAASPTDVVLCVLSGGASALLCMPADSLTLADKAAASQLLINSSASIEEINTVRKHLSAVKGGRLRAKCAARTFCTLAISDVIGDAPSSIGSGPTVADPTTFAAALLVIDNYCLTSRMPVSVLSHLREGAAGRLGETLKPQDQRLQTDSYRVIGNNCLALEAEASVARSRGADVQILTDRMSGNTHDNARELAGMLRRIVSERSAVEKPLVVLLGGETTLTVTGSGSGGRNQEFALVAGMHLHDLRAVTLLAAGSDGTDGPTDAAGAFADERTLIRAQSTGKDPQRHLAGNDVYPLLEAMGDLFKSGPTGTNVMDLVGAVIG